MTPELAQVCYNSIHAALILGFGSMALGLAAGCVWVRIKHRRMCRDVDLVIRDVYSAKQFKDGMKAAMRNVQGERRDMEAK